MEKQYAFLDEYGTNELDITKEGVSSHFIITAIIVNGKDKEKIINDIEAIRKLHFQKSEMKSSKIGKNHSRRKRILRDIVKINFHIFAVIIDKSKLMGKGFKFKPSFYKFVNGLINRELFNNFPDINVIADEHGSGEFMDSFEKYLRYNHMPSLFTDQFFGFEKSNDNKLIQIADLISGTLGHCFDTKKKSIESEELFSLIKPKIILIRNWPKDFTKYKTDLKGVNTKHDEIIEKSIKNDAKRILSDIQNNKNRDFFSKAQEIVIEDLLFNIEHTDNEFILTKGLRDNIARRVNETIGMENFRTKVIAKLRDEGLILASGRKGYKLPKKLDDIFEYLNHDNGLIGPMLHRVKLSREKVLLVTKGQLDILENEEYLILKEIMNLEIIT